MALLINLVVEDGLTRYKILRPIGQWGPAFTLPVYEAAILSPQDNNTYISLVAFKIINNAQEDYFNMAFQDVKTSQVFQHNSNILPFIRFFQANLGGATLLCIVLPYDAIVTSLRSLLSSNPRFSQGMDEKMIALVLERALLGLQAIHKAGKHHTRITADTVFFDLGRSTAYLAYAASLYERTNPNLEDLNCLPVNRMLAWGLAPEVKHDELLEFVDVYETEKSDIWLIGILSLELAYGRILVENRRELLDIANYISSNLGALTDTWEQLRIKSAEFARGGDPSELPIVLSVNQTRFSERFGGFVARCLDANPENRASAEELLNVHGFLRENVAKMKTLGDMVKGINPHVARFLDQDLQKKKGTSKESYHPSFRHNGITYTILGPVGTWGPEYNLTVYEAVTTTGFNDPSPLHVAFKMAKNVEGQFFELAMNSVEKNTSFNHINILPLNTHFCKHLKGIETLCMVLPFDSQVLSLRSIISTCPKFANGIPQTCIAVALLYAVTGLHVLHTKNEDHFEITAGNIFYHIEDKTIKLAYAASCYERTYPAEESGECPINNLLSWGSPPEDDILGEEGCFIYEYDTYKADIWFIGIAALELAYGRIRVANREELLRIASYIRKMRRLPDTWDQLRTETAEVEILKTQPGRKFLEFPEASEKPQRFDKYFGNFVAMCLNAEPTERPFANELFQDDFLRHIHEGESMEIFKATMIMEYRDLDKKKAGLSVDLS